MAISPADFYAYSRATGTPVPDSDEERAQMAGDVINFRRNQLRAPAKQEDEGFNLTNALGIGAAALGLGAGAYGLRRALMNKAPKAARTAEDNANFRVEYQNIEDLRRRAGYTTAPARSEAPAQTPAPSKVATQEPLGELWEPTVPKEGFARSYLESKGSLLPAAKPDAGDRFIEEYEQLARNQTRADQRIQAGLRLAQPKLRERDIEMQGKGERVLAELRQEAADEAISSVNFQENLLNQARNQAANALESGEDQQTGRIKAQLQRNEDLDLAQIENLENTYGDIHFIGPDLEDGLPSDQTSNYGVPTSQELADRAKNEMIASRQELEARGLRPGTMRFEHALAQTWAAKPGLPPGSEEFRKQISLPTIIRTAVEAASADPMDPLGRTKERTVLNIGPNAEIESTAAGTAIRGASPVYHEAFSQGLGKRQVTTPDYIDLEGRRTYLVDAPVEMSLDLPGANKLPSNIPIGTPEEELSKQEIKYSSLNRPEAESRPGGSAGIGVYGLEPKYVPGAASKTTGEYSAAASRIPSEVPKWIQRKEQTPFSGISSQGLGRAMEKSGKAGTLAIQAELNRRQLSKESIPVSEGLRRARLEGRDAQSVLREMGVIN